MGSLASVVAYSKTIVKTLIVADVGDTMKLMILTVTAMITRIMIKID